MSLVTGNTSTLKITCHDQDGNPIDLTGQTIKLKYKIDSANLETKTMSIVTATSGICSYQFGSAELTEGNMRYDIVITDGSGTTKLIQREPKVVNIRAELS